MAVQVQFVVDAKVNRTGVILSLKRYEKLLVCSSRRPRPRTNREFAPRMAL